MKQRVLAVAIARDESESVIVREALQQYFAQRAYPIPAPASDLSLNEPAPTSADAIVAAVTASSASAKHQLAQRPAAPDA